MFWVLKDVNCEGFDCMEQMVKRVKVQGNRRTRSETVLTVSSADSAEGILTFSLIITTSDQ